MVESMGCKYIFFVFLYNLFADCWSSQTLVGDHEGILKYKNVVVWFEPFVSLQDTIKLTKYDESSLKPLLLKVSSKFSAIMVHMTEEELLSLDWQYMTAIAVAKLNTLNSISSNVSGPTLRLWISFHYIRAPINDSPENSFHLSFLTKMAKDANAIFPGSVHALTCHIASQFQGDGKTLLTKYKTVLTIMHRERAKLDANERFLIGAMYAIDLCAFTGTIRIQLLKLVKDRSEVVFFDALTPSWHLTLLKSSTEAVQRFQDQTKQCKEALEGVPSRNTLAHVGVLGGFSDTTRNGDVDYSRLVTYWESLAICGRETNTVVILDRAFDTPYLLDASQATSGWWRLKENRIYTNPSQYIFEDKGQLDKKAKKVQNLNEHLNHAWADMNIKFHPSHVGVWAFPFLFDHSLSYTPETYKLLFEKLSQSFQKILIGPVILGRDYTLSTNLSNTLKLAAETNTQLINKLQVILVFDLPEDYLDFEWKNFNIMKQKAIEANLISKNTTKQVLFNYGNIFDDLYNVSINDIESYIMSNYTELHYDYGIILSLDIWCLQDTNLTIPLVSNWGSMSTLAISADVIWRQLVTGMERYLRKFSIVLENCQQRIQSELLDAKNQSLDVIFILNWNRIYYENTEIYKLAHFVAFWEGLNDWALEKNTTVFLGHAFDSGDLRNESMSREGWWIPTKNKYGENNIGQFSFEDKKSVISRLLKEERDSKQQTQLSGSFLGTMSIIMVSAGVVILLTLNTTIVVYVWRRYQLYQYLSKDDVNKFFKGVYDLKKTFEDIGKPSVSCMDSCSHQRMPYEKQKYEIKRSDFKIDNDANAYLGDGEFGIVLKGKVFRISGEVVQIAAKTTKHPPKKESLLGLLSEIKTLSYIGNHKSIVKLVGAYTAELHKGIVYVFLEYCHLGSLHNHLCRLRRDETKQSVNVALPEVTCDNIQSESMERLNNTTHWADFSRWVSEIASGMVFLASKYVVHADLATRNILLTVDRKAKIADFGLSRRMYNYKCYVKAGEDLLPWRWMAPESLRLMKFTEKSDVWSFGVLLWEIYSLGETPYPGVFWDADFANRLENGLRLCEPAHNDKFMYTIMLKCWHTNPIHRPAFIDVQAFLDLNKDSDNLLVKNYETVF